jgi:hypothetical protein
MKTLGNYILSGKLQAAGVISLLTVMSLLLPPFSYLISGAPVSLITLRKGSQSGVQVLVGAMLLTSIFGYFTNLGFLLGVAFALGVWLPVWLCSTVLRVTESQGLTVLAAGGVGIVFVLVSSIFSGDLINWWQGWIDAFLQQNFSAAEVEQMQELFNVTLPLINGIIAAGVVISLVMTVVLARWWQSQLFNPGGFRDEFHQLLLPKWLTVLTFFALLISLIDSGNIVWLVRNVLVVLIVVHTFQGIASIHRIVFRKKLSRGWLVTMYAFLVFLPQMALFLACIGMTDVWRRNRKSLPPTAE